MKLILFLLPLSLSTLVQKVTFPIFEQELEEVKGELTVIEDWLLFFYEPSASNRKLIDDFSGLADHIKTEDINFGTVNCRVSEAFCELMEAGIEKPAYLFFKGERVYRLGSQTGLSTEVYVQIDKDYYPALEYKTLKDYGVH